MREVRVPCNAAGRADGGVVSLRQTCSGRRVLHICVTSEMCVSVCVLMVWVTTDIYAKYNSDRSRVAKYIDK